MDHGYNNELLLSSWIMAITMNYYLHGSWPLYLQQTMAPHINPDQQ